ncbi:MAG: phosphoribosylamine--glycine ligase [Candidatus Nanopelagicales bacterium]
MRVLVIGSGGREHALVRALQRDPSATEVVCAPGNAGIAAETTTMAVDAGDPTAVADLADGVDADLVVIGPEVPLVAGAADAIRARGRLCFGPSAAAAQLEGSKTFAKEVMVAAGVPTALAVTAHDLHAAEAALDRFGPPYVVKDDGLAAGKGVVVTDDRTAALEHAATCLAKPEGRVVIEEFLDGPEVSLFLLSDGTRVVPLLPAQDFKRAFDGDEGPNTGGMGAYTPLPWAPASLVDDVVRAVAQPTIDEMARRGTPFVGLLYAGLALTSRGLRVVEFNVRFGDPETQAVLELLESPLGSLLAAAAAGDLSELPDLQWRDESAVIVVLAALGYPGTPRTGDPISGLAAAGAVPGVAVLHAGTAAGPDGAVVSAGGRVLGVVGTGADLAAARAAAYAGMTEINLPGGQFRSDIAARASEGSLQ